MGQFDNVIPVKVTSGKTVTTASIRAPKKAVPAKKAVLKSKEGELISRESNAVQGGAGEKEIPLSGAKAVKMGALTRAAEAKASKSKAGITAGMPVVRKQLEKNLRSTTMRLDNNGEAYDTEDVKIAKPEPVIGKLPAGHLEQWKLEEHGHQWKPFSNKTETTGPARVGAGLEDPKSSRNVKEEANLETTTMRLNKEGKAYDSDTGAYEWPKVQGNTKIRLGGQQWLDTENNVKKPNAASLETQPATTSTAPENTKVTPYTKTGALKPEYNDIDNNPESTTTMRQLSSGEVVEDGLRAAKYSKPEVKDTRAGQKFPIESLNTDWNDTKTSRGPRSGTHELNLNEEAQVKVPGQTAAQQRADMSRAATRTSAPSRDLGYDAKAVYQHAKTMAVRDAVPDADIKNESFKYGYHHTKATVMALAGMKPEDEGLLNKHLGSGSEHKNNLNTLYEHLTSRNRFTETSKPGKGTQYSAERGNVDVAPTSKDYFVPKGSTSLTHASKLGNKTLEGSTVPFDGYVPNKGADKEEVPYHAVNVHQGYHPSEETHPVTGERIRVFRHTDVPSGAIHVGDVAEEAMKSGKSMYRYQKQQGMQRDATKGPSAKSREGHGKILRSVIDQNTEAEVNARLPKARPEGGRGQVTRKQLGQTTAKTGGMTEAEENLASKVGASLTEGKFIEVGTASSLRDKYKAEEAG